MSVQRLPPGHPWEDAYQLRWMLILGTVVFGLSALGFAVGRLISDGWTTESAGLACVGGAILGMCGLFVPPRGRGVRGVSMVHRPDGALALGIASERRTRAFVAVGSAFGAAACALYLQIADSTSEDLGLLAGALGCVTVAGACVRGIVRNRVAVMLTPTQISYSGITLPWTAVVDVQPADIRLDARSPAPVVAIWVSDLDAIAHPPIAGFIFKHDKRRFTFHAQIVVRSLLASPFALLAAITFYAENPDRRAELDSHVALDRVRSLIAADPSAS